MFHVKHFIPFFTSFFNKIKKVFINLHYFSDIIVSQNINILPPNLNAFIKYYHIYSKTTIFLKFFVYFFLLICRFFLSLITLLKILTNDKFFNVLHIDLMIKFCYNNEVFVRVAQPDRATAF